MPLRHWHGPGMLLGSGTTVFIDGPFFPTDDARPTNHQSVHLALLQPPIFVPHPQSKFLAMKQHDESCLQHVLLAVSFDLSWMGSWGSKSMKPSAAWGIMSDPQLA